MMLIRTQAIISVLVLVADANGACTDVSRLAFAGGFGAASSSKNVKKPKGKRGGLSDIEKPPTSEAGDHPILDKWGLPPPTEEELYPAMPPGTEFITAPSHTALRKSEIKHALKDHLNLNLDRFDEHGIEKEPSPGRKPLKLRMIHQSPPVLAIDNFFSHDECLAVQDVTRSDGEVLKVASATFSPLAVSKRTSTSWFCFYKQMPALLTKAHYMLGIQIQQMEEPQIVRYRTGEEFSWHYDEVPPSLLENGGQRVMTLLVYLNDVSRGGGTIFRDLKDAEGGQLMMKPQKGSALIFFPANKDGRADDRTLHKGEVALEEKWITQMWIHQHAYRPVVPEGNTQEAALTGIAEISRALGYVAS